MVVDNLDRVFHVLSDPTRRAILEQLSEGSRTVHELAEPFELTQQAISKHIAELEKSGLLRKVKVGRENICTADLQALNNAFEWAEKYRGRWQNSLDQLEIYLAKNKPKSKPKPRGKK